MDGVVDFFIIYLFLVLVGDTRSGLFGKQFTFFAVGNCGRTEMNAHAEIVFFFFFFLDILCQSLVLSRT